MDVRFPNVLRSSVLTARKASSRFSDNVPKGFKTVYVGETEKEIFGPSIILESALFQDLLNKAEEEFGYDHPMGELTIPCTEETFLDVTTNFSRK